MRLTYIHHSAFLISTSRAVVIIDFWADAPHSDTPALVASSDKPVYVLASHVHPDHFHPAVLTWSSRFPIRYVLSSDIRRRNKALRSDARITWLHRGESFSDDALRVDALGSTDVGVSWLVTADGRRLFHAGDFNDWVRNSSAPEDNLRMHNYFKAELTKMSPLVRDTDAALFPADPHLGEHIADGAVQFCAAVRPKILVPMHSWGDFAAAEALRPAVEPYGVRFVPAQDVRDMIL